MKALIIITVYNRAQNTRRTLEALEETTDLSSVEVVIVNNASSDGAGDVAQKFAARYPSVTYRGLRKNVGCPRALNLAIRKHRKPHQPVVKLDNDVLIRTPGWVDRLRFLAEGDRIAMVSAYYDGVVDGRLRAVRGPWRGETVYEVRIVVGHCVWHSGTWMDKVGYFDVLRPDHLYGFEDILMSVKARVAGWHMLVWEGWRIENIQRWNALGDEKNSHVAAMRPHYNARKRALLRGSPLRTGPDGRPA